MGVFLLLFYVYGLHTLKCTEFSFMKTFRHQRICYILFYIYCIVFFIVSI